MDEKNGEVFDHHVELFAQIGSASVGDTLRDFVLNSSDVVEPSATVKNVIPLIQNSSTPEDNVWSQTYDTCTATSGLLNSHSRSLFNLPLTTPSLAISEHEVENASALLDNLVKSMPEAEETILNEYSPPNINNKNLNLVGRSPAPDNANMSNSAFENLHQINSEKVTHGYLNSFSKLGSSDAMIKSNAYESFTWNGLVCDSVTNTNFQSQNTFSHSLQGSVDKNGNSALFGSSHGDKFSCGSNSSEHLVQNNFLAKLSPTASLETCVRTPATSYESASPLSSNRTPIRSDESISPMGSGHTPLRVEESTSPLTSIKTPLRTEEGSPLGRTSHCTENGFSLVSGGNTLISNSLNHKPNEQTLTLDNYGSPPGILKKFDIRGVNTRDAPPRKHGTEVQGNENETESEADADDKELDEDETKFFSEKAINAGETMLLGNVMGNAEEKKIIEKKLSPDHTDTTAQPLEALIKQQTIHKFPTPYVTSKQIGVRLGSSQIAKRTLSRKSDSELYLDRSLFSGKAKNYVKSLVLSESCEVKTELLNVVPELEKTKLNDHAQKMSETKNIKFTEEFFNKARKRQRKSDSLCLPGIKRRNRKRVTIYQSSVSPEETGIKLKIKVASAFQKTKPQKKRRSKKQFISDDDEEENECKRSKKIVRFSSNTKESETAQQNEWGDKIPPQILQRIFQIVVDDQGCVPSLVRFSSVCKLWNAVANRPELWQNIDLSSPYIKQKCKIDRYFRWLLENRLENIRELNLSGWKFSNITMVLSLIGTHCTDIESIGLGGWQGLHYEHLKALLQDCPKLGKLDLSDVSPESKSANSAVSQKSITFLTQTMGERLTQLILAHNTLTCLPQIISSLATHCPNLQVLDLSNIRRVSHTEFALNIEHLQEGCQKLKVLRITNSCITLANVPLEKQVASPGFANLEELSIAGHQGTESLRITSVMDDSCLERILKTSHKLKLLDVRGCTRVTDSSLVRVPAWDIQHLFLSGCYVTRQCGSGLELIAQKWSHSLVEVDLAWTTVTEDLNAAVMAFAEKGSESPLRVMNLCGSAVTLRPVKALLSKCRHLESLNLQSCRGLPRGVKRLYENEQLIELRNMLEKKDRDSVSEGEDRKESESEGKVKESPFHGGNHDLVT